MWFVWVYIERIEIHKLLFNSLSSLNNQSSNSVLLLEKVYIGIVRYSAVEIKI